MNDIQNLYQELILDHSRSPKNFGELNDKTHHAHGNNPLCGDTIDVDVLIEDERILKITFRGDGCAIAKASASLMTESVKGHLVEKALVIFDRFHAMLVSESDDLSDLGKLSALKGVRQFPIRVKCATLCWHTLIAALRAEPSIATTE